MSTYLNAYPVTYINTKKTVCILNYSDELFHNLKTKYPSLILYRDRGRDIICFAFNEDYKELSGKVQEIDLNSPEYQNFKIFLLKSIIKKTIDNQRKNKSTGFNTISIISSKVEDDLIKKALHSDDFPFYALPTFLIDVRNIRNNTYVLIDTTVRNQTKYACNYFQTQGFSLLGRDACYKSYNGDLIKIGKITQYHSKNIICEKNGKTDIFEADKIYLAANYKNIKDYMNYAYKSNAEKQNDKIYNEISIFNKGQNKFEQIKRFAQYIRKSKFLEDNGIQIGDELEITDNTSFLEKPQFTFANSSTHGIIEYGLQNFGPYSKLHFDKNNPSICVICAETQKGSVETFIHKFLKGIDGHKNFSNGFEGKFGIGRASVNFFTFRYNTPQDYKKAIEKALEFKEDGEQWDLALVQIENQFKELAVIDNPYFTSKATFMARNIPVQDFTLEMVQQQDNNLGYSLNNMALAVYAKMGGVPWLLQAIPTVAHELVIGIGCAYISEANKNLKENRVMGITTVFSGSGQYILTGKSNAVRNTEYKNELTNVLKDVFNKIKTLMDWFEGDTIRIVFHSMAKEFNQEEITAVKEVVGSFNKYNIEYAFVKISKDHIFEIFDTKRKMEKKGCFAPLRGQYLPLSDYKALLCLTGGNELKRINDGHPQGVVISIHKDSTFKDIKYLCRQIYNFSAHSWRSYFPSPLPVTIMYSNLIAYSLGWLGMLPQWDNSCLFQKAGRAKWFL